MFKEKDRVHSLRLLSLFFMAVLVAAGSTLSGCSQLAALPVLQPLLQTSPTAGAPSAAAPSTTPTLPAPTLSPTAAATQTPLPAATLQPTDPPPGPVTIESLPVVSRFLGNARSLSFYLPPDYASQPQRQYKVLYVNDGQDLSAMGLEQDLNALYAAGELDPIIVVGIPASDDRGGEYGTGSIKNVDGSGAHAQEYINFLLQEVMPAVNARYRILQDPQNTGLIGWSLGGLTAFYVGWNYPGQVGIVGAFSGSFWWRTSINSLQDLLDSRVAQKMVRQSTSQPPLRMWFSAGTGEFPYQDRDQNGIVDMVQDTTDLVAELAQKGYQQGTDYLYEQIDGGTHDQSTWAKVLPDFLRWAFPPVK